MSCGYFVVLTSPCMQAEYLAVGEAPTEMRNVMRQRSRWTKGHMQV